MSLRTVGGHETAETIDDLKVWLRGLEGCPPVTRSVVATCDRPAHAGEPATWFYVEADPTAGVARLRCLACGNAHPVLDSEERWTFPGAWSCVNCNQSIAEVAFGVHDHNGRASWLVMAVRCVECGHLHGATDLVVDNVPTDDLLAQL
ncbi:MAG: hypothetical protein JO222_04005 [Frankiales bacterium]|nr:hypothetical protein [Frankiales bacterium]